MRHSRPRARTAESGGTAVQTDPTAIEGGADLVALYRSKVEGQYGIFVRRLSPFLDRCAISVGGIQRGLPGANAGVSTVI